MTQIDYVPGVLERLADLVAHGESLTTCAAPAAADGRACPRGGKCYLSECSGSYCHDRDAT